MITRLSAALIAVFSVAAPALACCSLQPAQFSNTKGYAGEGTFNGKTVHVLGYQNAAQNLHKSPNALLLPIPAKPGTMTEHNIIDTRAFKNVLQDMEEMVMLMTARRQGPTRGVALPSFGAPVVFQHDIYTIVLAPNARSIQGALDKVPVNKRPALNKEIFAAYDKWYPGWTFALCCFNNAQSAGAAPMVWWYEPLYKDKVFFPALDAIVRVDHTVMVGSTLRNVGSMPTRYSQAIPKPYADLFPGAISGKIMRGLMENGDFWCELQPDPDFLRQAPPGAITKKTQKHPSTQCAQQAASRRKIVSRPRA